MICFRSENRHFLIFKTTRKEFSKTAAAVSETIMKQSFTGIMNMNDQFSSRELWSACPISFDTEKLGHNGYTYGHMGRNVLGTDSGGTRN